MSINSLIKRFSVQTAVVWENPVPTVDGGAVYDTPKEIKCRWDELLKVITNNKGEEIISNAQILTNEELETGCKIFLGTLDDLLDMNIEDMDSSGGYPDPDSVESGVFEIVTRSRVYMPRSTTQCVNLYYLKPNWETKL